MAEGMIPDGFDDEDMEKPHLGVPTLSAAVPLVLSAADGQLTVQVPATINRYLRDYQRDGVRFLYEHFVQNSGAILADDMGLGKTVQVISFMAAVLGKTGTKADVFHKFLEKGRKQLNRSKPFEKGPFLIVSPGSVLYNWKEELETWGYFKQELFHGTTKEGALEHASRGTLDVVLTTYETLRNHVEDLNKVQWLGVVMDEAHRLKEPKAQVTVAAKALKTHRRYGLTGTPLQNRLLEFWCVLDWANPGSLGTSKRFDAEFGKAIRRGQRFDSTKRELAQGRKKSKELQEKLSKSFLRRTKSLIADQLPRKDEKIVFCPLTSFQEDIYVTILQTSDVLLIRKKNCPCDCSSGEDRGQCCYMENDEGESIKSLMLRYLQLLLKVANHAALLMPEVKQTQDQQRRAKEVCKKVFARYPEFVESGDLSSFEILSDPKFCGKMKVLDKLVKVFQEERDKVLLFSRSTQLMNILEEYLIGRGIVYRRLDGKTRAAIRTRLVRDFNNDPDVFLCLVSTKAGGLGLNFTGANVVIIFDPNWNPSSDLQAQDRAYRIGQRRNVRVYRLISAGTIEEMMYLRQVYKQQLANIAVGGTNERRYFTGVDGEKDSKGELFGFENLFSYRADGANLAKDIIKRTEKVEAGFRVAKYEPPSEVEEQEHFTAKDGREASTAAQQDAYDAEFITSQLTQDTDDEESDDDREKESSPALESSTARESPEEATRKWTRECTVSFMEHSSSKLTEAGKKRNKNADHQLENFAETSKMKIKTKVSNTSGSSHVGGASELIDIGLLDHSDGASDEPDEKPRSSRKTNFTRVKGKSEEQERGNVSAAAVIQKSGKADSEERCRVDTKSKAFDKGDVVSRDEGSVSAYKKRTTLNVKKDSSTPRSLSRKARSSASSRENDVETKRRRRRNKEGMDKLLESCGVRYTHANSTVVGPSAAENRMSKQAMQDVFELEQFSQQPANCYPAIEMSDESDDIGDTCDTREPGNDDQGESPHTANQPSIIQHTTKGATERVGDSVVFVGSTPKAIRRQHFRELGTFHGFGSDVEFAEAVLQSSVEERQAKLAQFYVGTNPCLASLDVFTPSPSRGAAEQRKCDKTTQRASREDGVVNKCKRYRRKGSKAAYCKKATSTRVKLEQPDDPEDLETPDVNSCDGEDHKIPDVNPRDRISNVNPSARLSAIPGVNPRDRLSKVLDVKEVLDASLGDVAEGNVIPPNLSKTDCENSGIESVVEPDSLRENVVVYVRHTSPNHREQSTKTECTGSRYSSPLFDSETDSKHRSYAASLLEEIIPTGNGELTTSEIQPNEEVARATPNVPRQVYRTSVLDDFI